MSTRVETLVQPSRVFQAPVIPPEDRFLVSLRKASHLPATFEQVAERYDLKVYHPANQRKAQCLYKEALDVLRSDGRQAAKAKLAELGSLLDFDLAQHNVDIAQAHNLPVEREIAEFPLTSESFDVRGDDGSLWYFAPAEQDCLEVPMPIWRLLQAEEQAGLRFNELWVCHELRLGIRSAPKGAMSTVKTALTAGFRILGSAVSSAMSSIAVGLDPCIVGVVRRGPWTGAGQVIVRWE